MNDAYEALQSVRNARDCHCVAILALLDPIPDAPKVGDCRSHPQLETGLATPFVTRLTNSKLPQARQPVFHNLSRTQHRSSFGAVLVGSSSLQDGFLCMDADRSSRGRVGALAPQWAPRALVAEEECHSPTAMNDRLVGAVAPRATNGAI